MTRPALALVIAALLAPPAVRAEATRADAFAGRIPPISGQLYQKAGRLEVSPTVALSLNDAFFTKYFGGLKIAYHFTESWSAGVHAAAGVVAETGSSVVCTLGSGCGPADAVMLHQVPGRIRALGGVEVGWAPVYGKLNVLAEKVAHFDLGLLAGADLISHDEILSREQAAALGGKDPARVSTPGGHLGIGARLFLGEWIAARLEVKDYVYAVKVPNAGSKSDMQNQIFAELGVSFFVPARNRSTR
jgi:outer membrane beta-barrel protein